MINNIFLNRFDFECKISNMEENEIAKIYDFELRAGIKSFIRVEVWLPQKWNGRFLGLGNGGYAGGICKDALRKSSSEGFACANTDMGTYPDLEAGFNNPDMWKDFGYRSTHLMTVLGKAVTEEFYGEKISFSYFWGDSTGGQQALSEAQRYPEDYDGIVAGVPANNRTNLHAYFMWLCHALKSEDGKPVFSDELVKEITKTAVSVFDQSDIMIKDPRGGIEIANKIISELGDKLSEKQKEALLKIYDGPVNPRTKERIYTPVPYGAESIILSASDIKSFDDFLYVFRWVFGSDYDYYKFDFDRDMDKYNDTLAKCLNANDPDLTEFKKHGGKLLMYSGSADPIVPYQDAVSYYENVSDFMGGIDNVTDFFRYFIVPGMDHGDGGPATDRPPKWYSNGEYKDPFYAVMNWRENGAAPEVMHGIRQKDGKIINDFKVLPYPQNTVRNNVQKISERYLK